ncbi:phage virion morphogenesis protein [Hymenobacter sp. BT664]|uniref:Phage virion morphogenesis protein n=1 Tax=Hymenobacter montanus TaxID=2771359 RepID=A0A927BF39_9BACT|nr:phage virion morphogenesis protein [Hymenobacter montanus]MBD2769716.1 phage virion morphogenesis protein [Hymenobacter montanus]
MSFRDDLKMMGGQFRGFLRELPQLAGAEMLDSVDQNFRTESFFGAPWAPRVVKKGNEGRALLVQSGRLRRSFQLKNSGLSITLFTDVPYAEIHNEGGTITGTAEIAAYERHQYEMNEVSGPHAKKPKWKKEKTGTVQVKAHSRELHIEIPQRQFMGEHPILDAKIEALIEVGMRNIFDG